MTTQEAHGRPGAAEEATSEPASSDGTLGAAIVGSLLGGALGGAALYSLTTLHLSFIGSIVGLGGPSAAFGAWMALALLMGLGFAAVADPAIAHYTAATTWLTARFAPLRRVVRPLMTVSPLGTVSAGVGLLYGLVVGGAVGLVVVPTAVGGNVPPLEANYIVAGYAVFGLFLGSGYGLALDGTIPVPTLSFLSPTVKGALLAPVVGGALSGALVYVGQPLYLRYLSTVPGYGTATTGFGIWMGLAVLFGLLFAAIARGHVARGNGTTGYGLVYGIVLAVFVGLLGIPAIVTASTRWSLDFGSVGGATLLAFLVYGLVLGSLFGKTANRRPLRPTFLVGRARSTVVAALLAGAISGGILYTAAPVYLGFFLAGSVGSPGSLNVGFAVWLALSVLLGVGFAAFPARRVERPELTRQSGLLVGGLYGAFVAAPLAMFVMPSVIGSATNFSPPTPFVKLPVVSYVLFGVLHGVVYDGIEGTGRITPKFLHGRGLPVLGSVLVGGAAGAAVVYSTSPVYFRILGNVVGVPTLTTGLGVWFGLLFVAGLLFVPLAARTVETNVGLPRGLGVGVIFGGILTAVVGAVLVPSLTNLALPHTRPPVAGYFVFGTVFGAVYGVLRRRTLAGEDAPTSTAVGTRGQRAIVFGSLFGGSVGGLVIHHSVGQGPVAMRFFGALVGYGGSAAVGWAVWLGLCLLLGLVFAVAVGPRLDGYTRSLDEFTEQDADLEATFGGFLDGAPITTTATVAGFGYGVVVAVAIGAITFPIAVNAITGPNIGLASPVLQQYFLLGFVVYGVVMGMGYGVMKEF